MSTTRSEAETVAFLESMEKFPGTLMEYNGMKGRKHESIDTGRSRNFVLLSETPPYYRAEEKDFINKIIDMGMTAVVGYRVHNTIGGCTKDYIGEPVRPAGNVFRRFFRRTR